MTPQVITIQMHKWVLRVLFFKITVTAGGLQDFLDKQIAQNDLGDLVTFKVISLD